MNQVNVEEEIRILKEKLQNAKPDEVKEIAEALAKLYEIEASEKKAEAERKAKKEQLYFQIVNLGITIALGVLPFICYNSWDKRHLKFEEDGTYASPQSRNLMGRMVPKLF